MFFNYHFFSSTDDDFSRNISLLFKNIPNKERVLTISVFGFSVMENYLLSLEIVTRLAHEVLGRKLLVSFIAQSPENKNTIFAEVCSLSEKVSLSAVSLNEIDGNRYLTVKNKEFNALLVSGVMADNYFGTIGAQSSSVFEKIGKIMKSASLPAHSILRQWNYIGQITSEENNRQNYQEFNNERARFYRNSSWENGYPAATGISMNINALIVDLIAVEFYNGTRILAVDNSMQLAAHRYSESVLGKSEKKETPKFERAKLVVDESSAYCFISGTAAILGEKSVENDNIETQTRQTILLIQHLISPENLQFNGINLAGKLKTEQLRVYVKQTEHFKKVRPIVENLLPDVNVFYVCAPVCRDELLVEIEGIATTEL